MTNKLAKQFMHKNLWRILSLVGLVSLAINACIPVTRVVVYPTPNPVSTPQATQAQTARREAQVQSVEIQVLPGTPTRINAVVRGNLTESCAVLGESQVTYASNTFQITVLAISPTDRGCVQIITPYETTVALNTSGLPAGTYTVNANGVSAVFTWPVAAATPNAATPTAPPTAIPTALPTAAPPALPTATLANQACIDSAAFVADVTIPDNTVVTPNTPVTKTWRLRNTGTCTWNNRYLVVYLSGTTMTQQPGYWIVQQGQTVAPGQTVDISVGLTSPVQNGNYASYWGLKNENGQLMPIQGGANGNSFYVIIRVNNGGTAAGKITAASIAIELEAGSGTVCTAGSTYFVHANFTANGAATATYEIGSTAGQIPAGNFQNSSNTGLSLYVSDVVVFDQAGTKTINLRFVGPYPHPDDITINLRVNGGEWHNTKLSCQ
jgi:hypothetical protein